MFCIEPMLNLGYRGCPYEVWYSYRMYGGLRFYDRKEIKDIIAYLRVVANPADDISLDY